MLSPSNLMPGLFCLVGLLVAGFGARNAWRDHASTGWPQVPGQVIRSSVEDHSDSDGDSYKPKIEYRYQVNGQELVGKRISFAVDGGMSSRNKADYFAEKYPLGRSVSVHYWADQPALCTLEPGLTKRSFVMFAFGLCFALFAVFFRLIGWLAS